MEISATELRQNLYMILDRVAEHGESCDLQKRKKITIRRYCPSEKNETQR